jgi:hypothetical protein
MGVVRLLLLAALAALAAGGACRRSHFPARLIPLCFVWRRGMWARRLPMRACLIFV